MGLSINGIIDRGLNQLLSSKDKGFIDNLSGIVNGRGSLNSITNMMEYLSNPNNEPKEFEGDWLLDYFQGRVDQFNLGPLTDIIGLDLTMMSQFDQALSFAQYSVDKLSNLGYGVGDLVSKMSNAVSDKFNDIAGSIGSGLRDNSLVKELFSYVGVLEQGGDPLKQNIHQLQQELLESNGYIINRRRSKNIAKSYHFITRPYLESDTMGRYRSYVFFTRPNCNLVVRGRDGKLYPHPQLYKYRELSALVESNVELYAELCRDNCSKSNLFTLLNNYCKDIPPVRLNETDRQGIQNKFGFAMPVTGVSNNNGVDLSVTFMDNADGDISKLLFCLDLYRREVTKGGYAKRNEYITENMIDTAMTAYMIVVDTNFNIISFAPCIGLHLSDPPAHFARHSAEGMLKDDILPEFTVTFKCFDFSPNDPSYYDAFNRTSGFDPSRVVDTSGSANVLYKLPSSLAARMSLTADKSITDAYMPHRRSVFDQDWYGFNGSTDLTTGFIEEAKSTFLNAKKSLGEMVINKANDFATSIGLFKDSSKSSTGMRPQSSVNFGYYMPYPDVFEFIAQFPGVYAVLEAEVSEPNYMITKDNVEVGKSRRRVKYRLGFSR